MKKQKLALLALLIVAVLACAGIARGENHRRVNINLVVVEHPTSPPVSEQIRLFEEGISRLSEVKIKPRIIKVDIVPDFYNVNSLDHFLSRLFTWAQYGKKERFKGIVFYLLPPMVYNQSLYGAGQAGAICVFTRNKDRMFAEGVMRLTNGLGENREPHSRIIALHEMLHLFGANHIDSKTIVVSRNPPQLKFVDVPNVMNSVAQAYATIPNLLISPKTHRQVRYCKKGLSVEGKKYV